MFISDLQHDLAKIQEDISEVLTLLPHTTAFMAGVTALVSMTLRPDGLPSIRCFKFMEFACYISSCAFFTNTIIFDDDRVNRMPSYYMMCGIMCYLWVFWGTEMRRYRLD